MRAKEIRYYLHNLDELRNSIEQLKADIHTFRSMEIDTIHINIITDMPRSNTNVITDTVQTVALRRVEQISRMENDLANNIIILRCIDNVICNIKGSIWDIINLRYLQHKQGEKAPTFQYIANQLGYSIDNIKFYDNLVVENIRKRYNNIIGT